MSKPHFCPESEQHSEAADKLRGLAADLMRERDALQAQLAEAERERLAVRDVLDRIKGSYGANLEERAKAVRNLVSQLDSSLERAEAAEGRLTTERDAALARLSAAEKERDEANLANEQWLAMAVLDPVGAFIAWKRRPEVENDEAEQIAAWLESEAKMIDDGQNAYAPTNERDDARSDALRSRAADIRAHAHRRQK